jgi:pSer/pThr/pTyr-binding forkhead associated (FHA) protein
MSAVTVVISMMSGPRDGERYSFNFDPAHNPLVINIGRRENCHINLSYDSQVSRLHARVLYDGARFILEDLDSRNGTFINDVRIEKSQDLLPGLIFRVGRTAMQIEPLPPDETQTSRALSDDYF